jgi:hypothetical protein
MIAVQLKDRQGNDMSVDSSVAASWQCGGSSRLSKRDRKHLLCRCLQQCAARTAATAGLWGVWSYPAQRWRPAPAAAMLAACSWLCTHAIHSMSSRLCQSIARAFQARMQIGREKLKHAQDGRHDATGSAKPPTHVPNRLHMRARAILSTAVNVF